jgi:uncharacterized membrane protein
MHVLHDERSSSSTSGFAFARVMETIALLGMVGSIGLVAYTWDRLPDRVPHHFDLLGRPDAWGGKSIVLTLPLISVIMYLGLSLLSRIPQRLNLPGPDIPERAPERYRVARELLTTLKAAIVWMFGWILWGAIQTALGNRSGLGVLFLPIVLTVLAGVVVFYCLRLRRG